MLRLLFIIILILTTATGCLASNKILITINQFVSHPALDAASLGIKEALQQRDIFPKKAEIQLANAQGNISTSVQIAKHQAALMPKFMIGISTPSAQANLNARLNNNITLGFVAVTDPIAIGLGTGANIIGVSDVPPIDELLEIAIEVFPKLKNIGVIYNPGEINSVKMVDLLISAAAKRNITVHKSIINSTSGIKLAVQKLIGKVDLMYLPLDNSVVSAVASISKETATAKLPIIANDPSLVDKGILFALGCDYRNSGKQLGFMIADMIEGKKIVNNIQASNIKELKINEDIAKKFGISIPAKIKLQSRNLP